MRAVSHSHVSTRLHELETSQAATAAAEAVETQRARCTDWTALPAPVEPHCRAVSRTGAAMEARRMR